MTVLCACRSFAGFSGQSLRPAPAPAPLPVAEVYYQQPPATYYNANPFTDPYYSAPYVPPVTSAIPNYGDSDLDPFFSSIPPVKASPPPATTSREPTVKKSLKERIEEQIMLLFVSGEINEDERDYLLVLGSEGNKTLRDALKAFENGDMGPLMGLLKARHEEMHANDEAIAR
jgi:hypothetical protein